MCDCCKHEGRNSEFSCAGRRLRSANLYKVYLGRVASVKLCHLCDIELFRFGEIRFLQNNLKFAAQLYASQPSSNDGFSVFS